MEKYTRELFGRVLKRKVVARENIQQIVYWADNVYTYICNYEDKQFIDIVGSITMMTAGPEFEYSYEELEKIADDLIAGKVVKLS